MAAESSSSSAWDTVLAIVDFHAHEALAKWGNTAVPSNESFGHLHCLRSAAESVPDELVGGCCRLRLLALVTKVLSLLHHAPGTELISAADAWVEGVANRRFDQTAADGWETSLREICAAVPSNTTEHADAQSVLRSIPKTIIAEVASAARLINQYMPPPILSQMENPECPPQPQEDGPDKAVGDCEPVHQYGPVRREHKDGRLTAPLAFVTASPTTDVAMIDDPRSRRHDESRVRGVVRSTAPAPPHQSSVLFGDVPGTRAYTPWTDDEEQRLIAGQKRYGNQWELIRKSCDLRHRFGTQLREKWRNLLRAGRA